MSGNHKRPETTQNELEEALTGTLPLIERLSLAYAPARARLPTLALFALDTRLAGLLRNSREPMLAQLRLAWWRENLERDGHDWPAGEPLIMALRSWKGGHKALAPLVDGWEALTGAAPLPSEAFETMVAGRSEAFVALACVLGAPGEAEAARELGRKWAMADLAVRLSNAQERGTVLAMLTAETRKNPRVSRVLRPLLVLEHLAQRRLAVGDEALSPMTLLKAMRLGLFGI